MGLQGLPSPPADDSKSTPSRKNTSSSASSTTSKVHRPVHRITKRVGPVSTHSHDHSHQGVVLEGRHKRCDGEFPCKRCKDDGLVCTAGVRKKVEYKQLPRGYAEVLENTQFALIATVHKLYSMVRNQQSWDLGEPELNDRGQPVIHNIAQKLGCIRPNSDIDLPVHSVFPEDEAGMAELARQLEEQQQKDGDMHMHGEIKEGDVIISGYHSTGSSNRIERASSSEPDHSDLEDYRKAAFGSHVPGSAVTLSPQSFTTSTDFEFSAPNSATDVESSMMFPSLSPPVSGFPSWGAPGASTDELALQYMQQAGALQNMDMLSQGLLESDFGTIKPHVLSSSNAGVMMGMGDPMIYSGYDGEAMRL
ncbi:hypothetical protein S40285_05319 [Stachybotrys chlorohalonatus IBT 40285]|uniref:Zn(2)-C6 fungal-type domain-containing protein n=1 Tax=Stachybotrys chlorohalonatus (strain IBT 40285) TaxID=1283841 RepID=A0A084QS15_STAC4|nr:hypothetical protein S40285_05319 [Stachybotrys chlorohalonata IBT 40285]